MSLLDSIKGMLMSHVNGTFALSWTELNQLNLDEFEMLHAMKLEHLDRIVEARGGRR